LGEAELVGEAVEEAVGEAVEEVVSFRPTCKEQWQRAQGNRD
jgi:hypothetical protein